MELCDWFGPAVLEISGGVPVSQRAGPIYVLWHPGQFSTTKNHSTCHMILECSAGHPFIWIFFFGYLSLKPNSTLHFKAFFHMVFMCPEFSKNTTAT